MAEISPWDEFERAMNEMREAMADLRKTFLRKPRDVGEPYIDVIDHKKEIEVVADLPGVDKDAIDISIDSNTLTISAEIEGGSEEKEDSYVYRERIYKRFARRITLTSEVDPEKARSSFKNGTLRITLPKKESKGRKIKIE